MVWHLQQLGEGQDIYSFNVDLSARAVYETLAGMEMQQDSMDPNAEAACET